MTKEINNKKEYRSLCSDTTFKYLWKKEKTRKILEEIVFLATGVNLEGFTLIDNELDLNLKSRVYVMDILLEKEGELVNIEMNPSLVKEYIGIRNHNYLYALLGTRFEKGEEFTNRKVIQINFNKSYCKEDKRINLIKANLSDIEQKIVVDENIVDYEIYLLNYKNVCYNEEKKNLLESYLSLFSAESIEELRKISNENKEMKILVDELERLNQDEHFGYMYDKELVDKKTMRTAYSVGKEDGILEGKLVGKEEEKIKTAKAMLKEKININKVAKCTGLSIKELQDMRVDG